MSAVKTICGSIGLIAGTGGGYWLGYWQEQQRLLCGQYMACIPRPFSPVLCLYSAAFYAIVGVAIGLIVGAIFDRRFPPRVPMRIVTPIETEGVWPPAPKF